MTASIKKIFALFILAGSLVGCGAYQPTKNVWKTTKGLWNDYVSPPASVDYDDKGELPEEAKNLSQAMLGIDTRLTKLERTMQNADKPPTQEWMDRLFENFPWLNGFAGIKNDGTILGRYPEESLKELDFIPLLYEDKKQNSRALRTDVQPTPLGPEILLATPLYDGPDFLGVVVAYFDIRNLVSFSANPRDMVVLCPTALLWPGKYDFAATPMAGLDWNKIVKDSSSGVCSNEHGSFFYVVRYLGNLPLIFASVKNGDFPAGDGSIEQGYAFFPREREKLPVPPVAERRAINLRGTEDFNMKPEEEEIPEPTEIAENKPDPNEIQAGSNESALLKGGSVNQRRLEERNLEGENVRVERVSRPAGPTRSEMLDRQIELIRRQDELLEEPEAIETPEPVSRPSPFGPRNLESEGSGSSGASEDNIETPRTPVLPGGRPSPFGPARNENVPSGSTGDQSAGTSEEAIDRQERVSSETAGGSQVAPDPAQSPSLQESKADNPFGSGLLKNREGAAPLKEETR
ncbi:MAG: hypothetical protein K2H64_02990 [Desulfovibrio sp.]|nr:hypothetical protein [Desulfovibrio sp.]